MRVNKLIDKCRRLCPTGVRPSAEEGVALIAEIDRLRNLLQFLIEEITDREGREGMTDADFAEQVIALAQATRDAVEQEG